MRRSPSARTRRGAVPIGTGGLGGNRFVDAGAVFAAVIQANVTTAAPGTTALTRSNLMKLRAENSAGIAQTFRDSLVAADRTGPAGAGRQGRRVRRRARERSERREQQRRRLRGAGELRGDVPHRRHQRRRRRDGERLRGRGAGRLGQAARPAARAPTSATCGSSRHRPPRRPSTCTDPGDPGRPAFLGAADLSLLQVRSRSTARSLSGQGIGPGRDAVDPVRHDDPGPRRRRHRLHGHRLRPQLRGADQRPRRRDRDVLPAAERRPLRAADPVGRAGGLGPVERAGARVPRSTRPPRRRSSRRTTTSRTRRRSASSSPTRTACGSSRARRRSTACCATRCPPGFVAGRGARRSPTTPTRTARRPRRSRRASRSTRTPAP